MRILTGLFVFAGLVVLGIGATAIHANPSAAQCSMSSCAGDHQGATHDHDASKAAKKQKESIDRLLSDTQGRQLLSEALMEDRDFMQALVARMMAIPEWRTLVSQSLSAPTTNRAEPPKGGAKPALVYSCPMHPEVTSPTPGTCPKCGMDLVQHKSMGM